MGTPTLSRLGSSFFSQSLTRRHTPETLSSATKPLLPTKADDQQQRRPSYHVLSPPARKSSVHKEAKAAVSHGPPISRHSSFTQAVINGEFNDACGLSCLIFYFFSLSLFFYVHEVRLQFLTSEVGILLLRYCIFVSKISIPLNVIVRR